MNMFDYQTVNLGYPGFKQIHLGSVQSLMLSLSTVSWELDSPTVMDCDNPQYID